MTVPPNAVAALVLLTTSYISDRLQSRGFMVISGCTLGGIGYMSVMTLFVLLRLLLSCDQDSSGRRALAHSRPVSCHVLRCRGHTCRPWSPHCVA